MHNKQEYKIYSRNRINIFNKRKNKNSNKKDGVIYIFIVILIATFTFSTVYKSVDPIFENICEDEARSIATKVTNDESTKVMANYNYNDMFKIEKDESRRYTNDKCKYIYH